MTAKTKSPPTTPTAEQIHARAAELRNKTIGHTLEHAAQHRAEMLEPVAEIMKREEEKRAILKKERQRLREKVSAMRRDGHELLRRAQATLRESESLFTSADALSRGLYAPETDE